MRESVFVLEDDENLGELLKAWFENDGRPTVWANSYESMIDAQEQVLECSTAFLDIDLGANSRSGVEAYEWLREKNFSNNMYFITAHGWSDPLVRKAALLGEAKVLCKPVLPEKLLKIANGQG